MSDPKKRRHDVFDASSSSTKKQRSQYLHDIPSRTEDTPQIGIEKTPPTAAQDQPTKAPRPYRRRLNNKIYKTPQRIEAIKGLHENPTDPRYPPVFQAIQPGYEDKLMVRGRGAVKPEDYAKVVADNFLSRLSTEIDSEPPSYPATPTFGFTPPAASSTPSKASVFTTIVPSINSAREKVNLNMAPQARMHPNAFEGTSNKSFPQQNVKAKSSMPSSNIICTDLAPYKLILQTHVKKMLRPLKARAKVPLALTVSSASTPPLSLFKAGVETKIKPVLKVHFSETTGFIPSFECTKLSKEKAAPDASGEPKSKRKVVSLHEYRLRQLNSNATKPNAAAAEALRDAKLQEPGDVNTDSKNAQREASVQPKISFKLKPSDIGSDKAIDHRKHQRGSSAISSRSHTIGMGNTTFDGSLDTITAAETGANECLDTSADSVPSANFTGFKISQPKQTAPQKSFRNPLKPIANSNNMQDVSILPKEQPESAKVKAPPGPAFKKAPRKETKPKEQFHFDDPKTFQPRKLRTLTQTAQTELQKPIENSKSQRDSAEETQNVEAVISPSTPDSSKLLSQVSELRETSSEEFTTSKKVLPPSPAVQSETLALLAKLVQLSKLPPKVQQAPPLALKDYQFGALLPLLPRVLSMRLEEEMNVSRKKAVVVEEDDEDEESEDEGEAGYFEEVERSLTIE